MKRNRESQMSTIISTLGFPRIGPRRELKTALEAFWSGKIDEETLRSDAAALRVANWARQYGDATHMPSNDFSLYDHVLDTSVMLGVVPDIYGWRAGSVPLETYFAMARGTKDGLPALEMTKWFDTNYHYMVPEFSSKQTFTLASTKPLDEYAEAQRLGYQTRPVLLGPVTYLSLGKSKAGDPLSFLPDVLAVYIEMLRRLANAGTRWVQIDEPCLVLDLDERTRIAIATAYNVLARAVPDLRILVATYFGGLGENLDLALRLPISGLHLDLVRAPEQLEDVLAKASHDLVLSLGVVDGRNIWRSDLRAVLDRIEPVAAARGLDHVILAPSCSLLHVPIDLELETELDPDLKGWLAFAVQKVGELRLLGRALSDGRSAIVAEVSKSDAIIAARKASPKIHDAAVKARLAAIMPQMCHREHGFDERRRVQRTHVSLPLFPTTTIGSFPQTEAVRKARAAHLRGSMNDEEYNAFLRHTTEETVRWQEEIGLDVLVHGEFERNDMVQYFGEQLAGYAFTKHGWVQSYGSRCVRPPIIYGDVSRPHPMTVEWSSYAQSLTKQPMKGMLTGPVTMLQWSFVRDDVPRSEVCKQIALALRDEVRDLEAAGIGIVQIDEPALREGLPLRASEWKAYLAWGIECFRLASSGVLDETQIHTHMCYSEFNDIIDAIAALDADVILIETARSKMELLDAFTMYKYPNEIGPGVYDIHAPRCPSVDEMVELLEKAAQRLTAGQIWVNPDCGLKTRTWEEVRPALVNMVEAAKRIRSQLDT